MCINQHDVLERNHQVGIMGSVYSNSACAFIWLGPGDEDSDRALSFIDSLQQILLEHVPGRDAKEILPKYIDLPEDMVLPSDDQAWAELEALLWRPWFHRSWTVQEPILAPNRMIACGSKIRGWYTFLNAVHVSLHFRRHEETLIRILPFLAIHMSICQKSEGLRLSDLIITNWEREASDPRDKVYALYGLVQGHQEVPLEISYAMSVEDIYKSTVRFCIENEASLSILAHVSQFRNQSDLPSWVPDWRDRPNSGCRPVKSSDNEDFHASSRSRPLLGPSFSNDKLTLKGFILAIVERTIKTGALRFNPAESSPDSWITNASAAGVPVRFLQGKIFQTSYDLTIVAEFSPFHKYGIPTARLTWPNSSRWLAAGSQTPIPQAVWREHMAEVQGRTEGRCLFLTKDSLGLAPAPTQVGDRVCILLGGDAPFILRPRQNMARTTPSKEAKPKRQSTPKTTPQGITKPRPQGSRKSARVAKQALEATEWTLIGDCYLNEYMHGEAMETATEADYVNFTLV